MKKGRVKVTVTDPTLSKSQKRKMEKALSKEFEKHIDRIAKEAALAIFAKLFS